MFLSLLYDVIVENLKIEMLKIWIKLMVIEKDKSIRQESSHRRTTYWRHSKAKEVTVHCDIVTSPHIEQVAVRWHLGDGVQKHGRQSQFTITWIHGVNPNPKSNPIPSPQYQISISYLATVMQNPHPHAYGDGSFLHLQTTEDEVVPVSGDSMIGSAGGNPAHDGGEITWQNARSKAEILAHPLYEQLLSAHVACLRIATPVDQLPRIDAQLEQSQNVVAKYSVLGGQQMMAGCAGDDKELDQFMVSKNKT